MNRLTSSPGDELSPGELRRLLERLEGIEPDRELFDDRVTIASVIEATGEDPARLADLLDEIRREDYRSRLSQRLRELEEPLYRVERPGSESRTDATQSYLARTRTLETLLDRLPTVDRHHLPTRSPQTSPAERFSTWAAMLLLGSIVLLTFGMVAGVLARLP